MHSSIRPLAAEVQGMSTEVSAGRPEPDAVSPNPFKAEAIFWFLLALMGQWMFVVHIAPWRAL